MCLSSMFHLEKKKKLINVRNIRTFLFLVIVQNRQVIEKKRYEEVEGQ